MQFWLVVWNPLKNISQLGWLSPIYGNQNFKTSVMQYHGHTWTLNTAESKQKMLLLQYSYIVWFLDMFGYAWQGRKHKHIMSYPPRYFLECTPNPWCLWETSDPASGSRGVSPLASGTATWVQRTVLTVVSDQDDQVTNHFYMVSVELGKWTPLTNAQQIIFS